MKTADLYAILNKQIPVTLSEEWDNDGLMVLPDEEREVKRILLCLDVTKDAVDYAILQKCDCIISHHPLIFHPLKALTDPKLIALVQHHIAVLSFHTRLDRVEGGVNDALARRLGLQNVKPFEPDGIGRIGRLPRDMQKEELCAYIKEALGAPVIRCAGPDDTVRTLAVLGGAGEDSISDLWHYNVHAFLSGEFSHHHMSDAPEGDLILIEGGHFYTENPVLSALEERLKEIDDFEILHFNSDVVSVM